MTNTPNKSETVEQRAREIYAQSPDLFYHSHNETRGHRHWGDLTEERREHFRDLARASSRPADQVPDMVEVLKAARSHLHAMQHQARQYLEPKGYTSFDRKQIALEYDQEAKDSLFTSDMIYLLDGPEQRELEAKIDAALQAVPAASEVGWQPIESAPKDGTPVLLGYFRENLDGSIYQEGGAPVVAAWIPTKKLADDGAEVNWVSRSERLRSSRSFSPTHWRPLPAPPALKASGEE